MNSNKLNNEKLIELIKSTFIKELCYNLNLTKVSSPVVVLKGTGVNDNLNGFERPVGFPIKDMGEQRAEVVHSLAKWKRLRLKEYDIPEGAGIITDMRALRPDEEMSTIHSIYVDQFDWEKHISKDERSLDKLRETVKSIYSALTLTAEKLYHQAKEFKQFLPKDIKFIHTEELLEKYPDLTPKERENVVAKEFGAVFVIGIGGALADGKKHDGRAPDYDDWSTETESELKGLNGDIIVWNPILNSAFEISSMGIRVDKTSLQKQLEIESCTERKNLYFHRQLLNDKLPQSIGGGIGQSRLAMLLLQKKHIGEVQVSIWSDKVKEYTDKMNIKLL